MNTPKRTFLVNTYDAYSGWDCETVHDGTACGREVHTRREAWAAVLVARTTQTPVMVTDLSKDAIVYSEGSEQDAAHAAWLQRCPN
jgi:hypothetical protein